MSALGKGGGGGETASVSLNLTALMDILSNLLFFLLASYSSQAAEVAQNIKLPSSSSQLKLDPALTITVTARDIQLAGVPVAEIDKGMVKGLTEESEKIGPLFDRLKSVKAQRTAAGKDDMGPESEMILLMADKSTDSLVITKILKTAGSAGFVNVRFGVTSQ